MKVVVKPYVPPDRSQEDLYISYWRYSQYKQCPAKLDWMEKIPRDKRFQDGRNAVVGSIIHTIVENYLHPENPIPLTQAHGMISALVTQYERDNFVPWRGANDRSHVIATIGMQLVQVQFFLEELGINKTNSVAETTIKILEDDLRIGGRIDITNVTREGIRVYDWKCTETEKGKTYIDDDQMFLYFLLLRHIHPNVPLLGGAFLLPHFGDMRWVDRNPEREEALLADLQKATRRIRAEAGFLGFIPGRHCGYCDFKDICPRAIDRTGHSRNIVPEEVLIAQLIELPSRQA